MPDHPPHLPHHSTRPRRYLRICSLHNGHTTTKHRTAQPHHPTATNPLNEQVRASCYNQKLQELYIGTTKGEIEVRSLRAPAGKAHGLSKGYRMPLRLMIKLQSSSKSDIFHQLCVSPDSGLLIAAAKREVYAFETKLGEMAGHLQSLPTGTVIGNIACIGNMVALTASDSKANWQTRVWKIGNEAPHTVEYELTMDAPCSLLGVHFAVHDREIYLVGCVVGWVVG